MRDGELLKRCALVVLNYKTPQMTVAAVRHLLDSHTGLQLIVVDNCSGDDSAAIFQRELAEEKDVHLVFNEDNRGYAHGNNVGIDAAKALGVDFVGVMNPDVIIDANDVAKMLRVLADHEDIGLITGETYYSGVYHVPNPCAWHLPTLRQLVRFCTLPGYVLNKICRALGKWYDAQNYYPPSHYEGKPFAYVEVVQGCFFLARLSTLLSIGKLDEETFLYYEENILGAKLAARGMRSAVMVGCYVHHNHQEKERGLQKQASKLFDMGCMHHSRRCYIEKYLPCHPLVKRLLLAALEVDFEIRKLGVRVLYRR